MNTTGNPPPEDARDLDYLLSAYLFDNLSEEGCREVEERLAADPAARAEFEELRATLELVEESLGSAGDPRPGAYSFESSRRERVLAASRRQPAVNWLTLREMTRGRIALLGIAALLVGFVSACSLYLLLLGGASAPGDGRTDGVVASSYFKTKNARLDEFSEPQFGNAAPTPEEGAERSALQPPSSQISEEKNSIAIGGGAAGVYGRRLGRASVTRKPAPKPATKAIEKNKEGYTAEAAPEEAVEELAEVEVELATKPSEPAKDRVIKRQLDALKEIDATAASELQARIAKEEKQSAGDKSAGSDQQRDQLAEKLGKKTPVKAGKGGAGELENESRRDSSLSKEAERKGVSRIIDKIGIAGAPDRNQAGLQDKRSDARELRRREQGAVAFGAAPPGSPASDDGLPEGREVHQGGANEKTKVVIAGESFARARGVHGSAAGKISRRPGDRQEEADAGAFDSTFADEAPGEAGDEEDVGFVDGDFSFDEEAEDENNGVVEQLADAAGNFRNSPFQGFVPGNGNYRLNITRQGGRLIPLGNDAILANPQAQGQWGEEQTAAESSPAVTAGTKFAQTAQEQEHEEDLLVVNEDTLNTFSYYRNLDGRLSFEQFRSRTLVIPPPAIGDEGLGEKGFRKKYGVNPFVATSRDHLSTFGMDVDNASWGRVRENLKHGELPSRDVVRVEEFVNNFSDERPGNPDSVFTVFTEGGPSPFGESELELLQITIKSRGLLPEERKNAVLTFAVDTSGSMASDGKMKLLQESLKALVANLGPNDRVAIVAFSTNAFVVLPHTSVRQRAHIEAAIDSLSPDGGTNVEAGIDLAYRLAGESHDRRAANRVILCSDGVANLGAKGPEAILERIRRFAEGNLVSLFTYAFGTGGRQAVQGDRMLQRLADEGDGRYQYVDSSASGRNLFSLPDRLQFLASDAKIQVDFNPEVISHYRLLGYEKRDIADVDFRNDTIDAGEIGPGSTVTAIYEIKRSRPTGSLGRIHLRYRDETSRRFEEIDFDLPTGVLAGRLEDTTDRFRFIAAVAEFAEILRQSYYARDGSYGAILQVLSSNSPRYQARAGWKEARELISTAQGLSAVWSLEALEMQEGFGN